MDLSLFWHFNHYLEDPQGMKPHCFKNKLLKVQTHKPLGVKAHAKWKKFKLLPKALF